MVAHLTPDPLYRATIADAHRQLDEFVAEGAGPDPFADIDWGKIRAEQELDAIHDASTKLMDSLDIAGTKTRLAAKLDAILADAEALAFDECPIAAGSLVKLAREQLQQPCPDCEGQTGHVAGTINGPAWLDCPTCNGTGENTPSSLLVYKGRRWQEIPNTEVYTCGKCQGTGRIWPALTPEFVTAYQVEARFGLEEARDLLTELYMTGFDADQRTQIIARIDQAISVLP